MKRLVALIVLLAALGVVIKLTIKGARPVDAPASPTSTARFVAADPRVTLAAKYPAHRVLVERVVDRYRQTAERVEKTDGLRGLTLLDRLDLEAVFLYEQYPRDFRRLASLMGDESAAEILLAWRDYVGLKHGDERDRRALIAELGRLPLAQRRLAAEYPNALPFLLADPKGTAGLIRRHRDDSDRLAEALAVLSFVRLDEGATDLRVALRTLEAHGDLTIDACRLMGLDGLALVGLFGATLEALGDSLSLQDALILLKVNADGASELLRTRTPEAVARVIQHVGAAELVSEVASSPYGLRLAADYGDQGLAALREAGPDAAGVVFADYVEENLRLAVVDGLARLGKPALAVLTKYAEDGDFRQILRHYGSDVLPPIIEADFAPELLQALRSKPDRTSMESLALGVTYLSGGSGQAMIQTIRDDGLERVHQIQSTDLAAYQLLPLYDVLHLGDVVRRGYSPTKGELTWAVVDGCLVVIDALSLLSFQPEGVALAEAGRSQLKATAREAAQAIGREAVDGASRSARRGGAAALGDEAAEFAARAWLVQSAGGAFELLRRLPEVLPRLDLVQTTQLAEPLCRRAGIRLTNWKPLAFTGSKGLTTLPIPVQFGLRQAALQSTQAGVGWVGLHKMEEHLSATRPGDPGERPGR